MAIGSGRMISSGFIGQNIVLEKHEEEALHRMHDKLKQEVQGSEKTLMEEKNLFRLVEQTEQDAQRLKELNAKVAQLTLFEQRLKNASPLGRAGIYQQLNNIASSITHDEQAATALASTIESRVNYILKVANQVVAEKRQDEKIEQHFRVWATEIKGEVEKLRNNAIKVSAAP